MDTQEMIDLVLAAQQEGILLGWRADGKPVFQVQPREGLHVREAKVGKPRLRLFDVYREGNQVVEWPIAPQVAADLFRLRTRKPRTDADDLTVGMAARILNCSPDKVIRMFKGHPAVWDVGDGKKRGKRAYHQWRIPRHLVQAFRRKHLRLN